MNSDDRKILRGVRREEARKSGALTHFRSVRFKDRKKEARRNACRGRVSE